jgi:hypothetical protein
MSLREFLKHTLGDKFDEAYLNFREADSSRETKLAVVVPLIELALLTFHS